MTDRGKTIMCGVLFLDIAEYSKRSVSGQISLKERFNAYLSVAIRDIPLDDRIILDTGDGAALSFLGDVGDALQVALSMRESLREGMHMEPPLLVRMGINLGPVRLVRDLNGQPNIVGDGINVAQRIMGFSDPGQILVSRSYYDAVSRLSPEFASMFHYQGSRTDKHVREHEIYAIGYPGEFTSTLTFSGDIDSQGDLAGISRKIGKSWQGIVDAFIKASPLMRTIYAGMALAVVGVLGALGLWLSQPATDAVNTAKSPGAQVAMVVPASAVMVSPSSTPVPGAVGNTVNSIQEHKLGKPAKKPSKKAGRQKVKPQAEAPKPRAVPQKKSSSSSAKVTAIAVSCAPDTSVYIDGQAKGKTGRSRLQIEVSPGSHMIMLLPGKKSQVYSTNLDVAAGKIVTISPSMCR